MRLRTIAVSAATAVGLFVFIQGCFLQNNADDGPLCTPGAYVFCRCADRAEGTKLCKEDGKSFEPCATSSKGLCVGGEVPDERTNQPVNNREDDLTGAGTNDSPDAIQACPGKSTAVLPNATLTLEGDTTTATGDRVGKSGACAAGTGGKDHVYHLIPTGSGSLDVKVEGDGALQPLAYLRTTCEDKDTQVACGAPNPGGTASLKTNVVTGRDYFLIIDGASASAGKYTATLTFSTQAFCGDGVVQTNEACDDGNKIEGDGCSNNCLAADGNPATGGTCDGHQVDVWPNRTVLGSGSTASYGNTWNAPDGACNGSGTNDSPDHIYAVTTHANGSLVVSLTPTSTGAEGDLMLVARRTCDRPDTMAAGMCSNASGGGGVETLSLPINKEQTVYIAVDGAGNANNKGDYTISFKLQ